MTNSGKLLNIGRERQKIAPIKVIDEHEKFIKNNKGRCFINANSNSACLQSKELDIHCEIFDTRAGLERLKVKPNFRTEEVAFSNRHTCLLSDTGDVWCNGDNSCGQITGRHDGVQRFEELHKVDFLLGPAKQLFAYPGGTCALLKDGRVQCFGLGASVIRKRLLPDEIYSHSFAWYRGFRPENICLGGAESGI